MKQVYYYNEEGEFSSQVMQDGDDRLKILEQEDKIRAVSFTEPLMCKMLVLPIVEYKTRHGDIIYLASRNDFEAKCLIKNHLDLEIHIETSYPAYVYNEYSNSIHDDLFNRLVHKTTDKFRFSLQEREWNGRVEVIASI